MIQEFKAFISRGNVVDLAVGIIIGAAFTAIVTSLVNDILMPPLGWILGGLDFTNYFIVLGSGDYATLDAAKAAGAATINYGLFLNAVIKFLIVAWALFILSQDPPSAARLRAELDAVLGGRPATLCGTAPDAQGRSILWAEDETGAMALRIEARIG